MISHELNLQAIRIQKKKRAISPSTTSNLFFTQKISKSLKNVATHDPVTDECKTQKTGCFCDSCLPLRLSLWSVRLLKLQPKVYMTPQIIECCICLFKRLCEKQVDQKRIGDSFFCQSAPATLIQHIETWTNGLVACWWIAMKHCSFRTAIPNRTLISRATGANAILLADCEVKVLQALDWNINSLLKESIFLSAGR